MALLQGVPNWGVPLPLASRDLSGLRIADRHLREGGSGGLPAVPNQDRVTEFGGW